MKLKPQAQQEYEELKKAMDYVNSHPDIDGKYKEIEFGNLTPEARERPILVCKGDVFLKVEDEKYSVELARNYLGPRWSMSDKGIYLRVQNIIQNTPSSNFFIYGGILHQLRLNQSNDKLVSEELPFALGYQPIDASKTEEQVDWFFSTTKSIIKLINSSEVGEKVRDLEEVLRRN